MVRVRVRAKVTCSAVEVRRSLPAPLAAMAAMAGSGPELDLRGLAVGPGGDANP